MLRKILCLLLAAALLLSLAGCFLKKEEAPEESRRPAKTTEATEETEAPLSPEELLAEELKDEGTESGYKNAYRELTVKTSTAVEEDMYYRYQQNYEGLPVYGRNLVCVVEGEDERLVTGNVRDIAPGLNTTPQLSAADAEAAATACLLQQFGQDSAVSCAMLNPAGLCVFNLGTETDHLAYEMTVLCQKGQAVDFCEVLVDAHSGEILRCESQVLMNTIAADGQLEHYPAVPVEEIPDLGYSYLSDSERKIVAMKSVNQEADVSWWQRSYEVYPWNEITDLENERYVIWKTESGAPDPDALDAYMNVQRAYDYFDQVLQNPSTDGKGMSTIRVQTNFDQLRSESNNDRDNMRNNAFSCSYESNGQLWTLIGVGINPNGPTLSVYLDVMAHEYTHGVDQLHCAMVNKGETGAIKEGLADIFGELVEAWYWNRDPDWYHGPNRCIYDPSVTENPSAMYGKYWKDPTDSHDNGYVHRNSTVISHAAYLMWLGGENRDESKRLSTLELGKLWYRAMLKLPTDCSFSQLRTYVLQAAYSMALTDDQRLGVYEAFQAVGIYGPSMVDFKVGENSSLLVYGFDSQPFGGYTMEIQGESYVGDFEAWWQALLGGDYRLALELFLDIEPYYESRRVEEAGAIPLGLPHGSYEITLSEIENPSNSASFRLYCGYEGEELVEISTDFGKKPDYLREAELYNAYLLNGGYEEVGPESDYLDVATDYTIESCLADLDGDGTAELLLRLTNAIYGGVRGPEAFFGYFDIIDGVVTLVDTIYYGGGSLGGTKMDVFYDTQTGEHFLCYTGSYYLGSAMANVFLEIVKNGETLHTIGLSSYALNADTLQDEVDAEIANVQAETDLYEIIDDRFYCYRVDGEYVSSQTYEEYRNRFVTPEDYHYRLRRTVYDRPAITGDMDPTLLGTWHCTVDSGSITYVFREDGSVDMDFAAAAAGGDSDTLSGAFTITNGQLYIYYLHTEQVFNYRIDGDKLFLEFLDGDDVEHYTFTKE